MSTTEGRPTSRRLRLRAWTTSHPRLFASRHVVLNLLGTLAAVLGVSALLRALLPRLDVSWLPALPDLHPPEWLRYLDPATYLAPLFGWIPPLLEQIPEVELGWLKYLIGFVLAVSVAVREVHRRRRVASEPIRDDDHHERP